MLKSFLTLSEPTDPHVVLDCPTEKIVLIACTFIRKTKKNEKLQQ